MRLTHQRRSTSEWVVVVPVKGTQDAKSRFGDGDHSELALAMALDTVDAVLATPGVVRVVVVTSEAASRAFDQIGASVLVEENPAGLTAAIAHGMAMATKSIGTASGLAVLLGDLPALTPDELEAALEAARGYGLAMVPDAEGTGTVLITATAGAVHWAAFGPGSNAAHSAAGYVSLDIPVDSGLRNDVDTLERLRSLGARIGVRTRSALG